MLWADGNAMTVTRLFPSGAYEVSALRNGHLVRHVYYGFTRREAVADFRLNHPKGKSQ
jgi:hypothetical protein